MTKLALSHFLAAVLALLLSVVALREFPVIYALPFVLLFVFSLVTGLGLFARDRRAIAWSVLMPFVVIPLWLVPWFVVFMYIDLRANGFEGTHGYTPGHHLIYSSIAAVILLPFWIWISVVYWRALKRARTYLS
ncbi:MAG: hypothetical protein ABFD54_04900 [Armatimonadota bacterium]